MSSVLIGNLDADVIGLGQDCTNPLFVTKPPQEKENKTKKNRVALSLEEDDSEKNDAIVGTIMKSAASAGSRATVSLSDCLACSGCVTSAETVLLSEDSASTLREMCTNKNNQVTCAISRASLASLADALDMDLNQCLKAIKAGLAQEPWSINTVVTSDTAQQLAATLVAEEFLSRIENFDFKNNSSFIEPKIPEPTIAISRTKYRFVSSIHGNKDIEAGLAQPRPNNPLPMLCGECPGVVCFLEKNAPHVLPYLASAKSGMAVHAFMNNTRNDNYQEQNNKFVAVAPCADKKLEAARRDLSDGENFDIDLVLTTSQLLEALGGLEKLRCYGEKDNDNRNGDSNDDFLHSAPVSQNHAGSGAYLEYTYRFIAAKYGIMVPSALPYERVRNDDFYQVALTLPEKTIRFSRAYGFRNVQKIANSIKRGDCPYHFVEIMACPSGGCLNGGGQIISEDERSRYDIKRRVERVSSVFHTPTNSIQHLPEDDPNRNLLYTRFHHIPSLQDTLHPGDVKW
mmetsp:Transcript_2222/g.3477  ORF Transcript_2222/g.3477 Transcript_2222/m.3477 type:complete len:513 (+) Transcript_2222:47-1585(+)